MVPLLVSKNQLVKVLKRLVSKHCAPKHRVEHFAQVGEERVHNEVFARKEEQKEIGQLEHNKVRRLHQLYVSFMRRI